MSGVKVYNVLVPVVDLVTETSEENAIAALRARLIAAGFDPHDEGQDAFESEDQP